MEEARRLIENMLGNLGNCSLESGVCCCGESMANHSDPMSYGHTPVDMGWHASDIWIKEAEGWLKANS